MPCLIPRRKQFLAEQLTLTHYNRPHSVFQMRRKTGGGIAPGGRHLPSRIGLLHDWSLRGPLEPRAGTRPGARAGLPSSTEFRIWPEMKSPHHACRWWKYKSLELTLHCEGGKRPLTPCSDRPGCLLCCGRRLKQPTDALQ